MVINAFILATATTAGYLVLYSKLPRKVRRFIEKYTLITEIVIVLFTYLLHGWTVTALLASAIVGIIISALLYVANHPDDFVFLYDLSEILKVKVLEMKAVVVSFTKNRLHVPVVVPTNV